MKNLSSRESAIDDMVTDYTQGGTRLIDNINEAHAEDRAMLVDHSRNVLQSLEDQFGELTVGLERRRGEVGTLPVLDLEPTSRSEKELTQSHLEAAVGVYMK